MHRYLRRALTLGALLAATAVPCVGQAQASGHPSVFLSRQEALAIRAARGKYPVLDQSLARARQVVDAALAAPMDVPQPGEAGGYAHERHKQNYREMQLAGTLYQVTGDVRYAHFVRDMLEKYAVLYPTLGAHPLAKDQAPGKLFHQSLNEANWLLATAIAYDCVWDALTPAQRARYEKNVFRPMADWLSVTQAHEFDRIHNHGTWATAAVGTLGYVLRDSTYIHRALYGTTGDRTGGFIRQLDLLFSPDGYYMEGAYYVRYALLPFFQFAEAVQRNDPSVKIYDYRGQILKKALQAAMQVTYPNGVFIPINDASRTMDITSPEAIVALDLGYARYGANANLLAEAALQKEVILNGSGLAVARDLAAKRTPLRAQWPSVEFRDGPEGKDGGIGILRSGSGENATMLVMKYGVHGQGHGHFDKLHFMLYDAGREVVPDYGFSRWINIEPKFGGRYLPENDTYAKQTIAHNTVVVDSASQSNGNYRVDEAKAGQRHFFQSASPSLQVMSAKADGFYDGVGMQRTMFLLRDARLPYPLVVDLYRLASDAQHTYDLPVHFRGQLITTSAALEAHTTVQRALGGRAGYQHLWREATGTPKGPLQLTWLEGERYYTWTTAATPQAEVIVARTGAGDPNFNLVSEPVVILRERAGNHLFASVIEPHGYFSEKEERSAQARPLVESVQVLAATAEGSVVEVRGKNGLRWVVMVANGAPSTTASHQVQGTDGRNWTWTGNYSVQGLK